MFKVFLCGALLADIFTCKEEFGRIRDVQFKPSIIVNVCVALLVDYIHRGQKDQGMFKEIIFVQMRGSLLAA